MLTLCVNGTLSGPILRALGLAKLGEAREAITARYSDLFRRKMFEKLLRLLGEPRFADVDFGIIKKHVSFFDELTAEEIKYAVKSYKETTPVLEYNEPNLTTLKPYMDDDMFQEVQDIAKAEVWRKLKAAITMASYVQISGDDDLSPEKEETAPAFESKKDRSRQRISHPGLYADRFKRKLAEQKQALDEGTNAEGVARMTELRKVFIELLQFGT